MNDDLLSAAVDYSVWYTTRFGNLPVRVVRFPVREAAPDRSHAPSDIAESGLAQRERKAQVERRFHDNRHTFVTDLAENGASNQMIQDLVGHVSSGMVKHYSHMRTEAKRRAVEALSKPALKPLPAANAIPADKIQRASHKKSHKSQS